MHGGLSPELKALEQIKRLSRPADVPDTGLLCDLLWADPEKDIQGWGENDRGVSYTFGADTVTEFLQKHDLDLICRAHQVCCKGQVRVHLEHCYPVMAVVLAVSTQLTMCTSMVMAQQLANLHSGL